MIKVGKDLIKKVAELARLNLKEKEIKKFTSDFEEILDAFKVLDEINVNGIKSSFRPFEEKNILREDKVQDCINQKEALKFTKNKENGFFIGPKTIE